MFYVNCFFAKRDITFIEAKIDIQVLCKKQKNKKKTKKNLNAKKKSSVNQLSM